MKYGIREICNVVFKAKSDRIIGNATFKAGQPVLYIDTATTSNLEQAVTTVYAQGGQGNARLVAWDGEKTLTFTVTDALISPIGLSVLAGAGLFKTEELEAKKVHVHMTANASVDSAGKIDLSEALASDECICPTAPIFVSVTESDGSITGEMIPDLVPSETGSAVVTTESTKCKYLIRDPNVTYASVEDTSTSTWYITRTENSVSTTVKTGFTGQTEANNYISDHIQCKGKTVFVDFYTIKGAHIVNEIQIDAQSFGGNFYVEASTLFRDQATGADMPAEITFPNAKIQSNFTFSMAATGDPSTFDFTMDAMPGYTYFDKTHKVMCVIQIVEESETSTETSDSVMKHGQTTGGFGQTFASDNTTADSTPSYSGESAFVLGNK